MNAKIATNILDFKNAIQPAQVGYVPKCQSNHSFSLVAQLHDSNDNNGHICFRNVFQNPEQLNTKEAQ